MSDTTAIIDVTATMFPSTLMNERSLLPQIARSAMTTPSKMRLTLPTSWRRAGASPGRRPCACYRPCASHYGHHPVDGLLEAGAFIELAEDSGLILDLGAWVLDEACRQAGEWHRQRPDFKLMIRVNLSARQIAQPDLVNLVVEALAKGGIESSSLCLEITETALMADPAAGLKVLQDLRSLGVELAIDDFGTGYSSLSYLKRFPVDVLKIDRSFVDGLGDDPEDTAIVTAIISLGRALGLRVVAEGVETERQLAELRRLGCDRAQGFMFARPGPASQL